MFALRTGYMHISGPLPVQFSCQVQSVLRVAVAGQQIVAFESGVKFSAVQPENSLPSAQIQGARENRQNGSGNSVAPGL